VPGLLFKVIQYSFEINGLMYFICLLFSVFFVEHATVHFYG